MKLRMAKTFIWILPILLASLTSSLEDRNERQNHVVRVAQEPHWWKLYWMRSHLHELRVALPAWLYRLLASEPPLAEVLKEALHDAFQACQAARLELEELVSCTVQASRPFHLLFPIIPAYDSRDFSFLLALTTSFAVRAVAVACAEGRLKGCSCDGSTRGLLKEGSPRLRWSECNTGRGSDNLDYALQLSKRLVDAQYACVVPVPLRNLLLHNLAVGRLRVGRHLFCSCSSRFGHCDTRECQLKIISKDELITKLRSSLWNARKKRQSNDVELGREECVEPISETRMRRRSLPLWFVDYREHTHHPSFFFGFPD